MNDKEANLIKREKQEWENKYSNTTIRDADFTTVSSMEVSSLSTPDTLDNKSFIKGIGFPGSYPYTRGIYDTMYRGRLWTMRQFAGFGSPEQTNERFKFTRTRTNRIKHSI